MSFDPAYIDRIVQSVLSEMRSRGTAGSTATAVKPGPSSAGVAEQIVIAERVISESVLVAAGASGRTVVLSAGAVITPSGRDYIRRNKVTLSSSVAGKGPSVSGLIIGLQPSATLSSAAIASGWKVVAAASIYDAAAMVAKEFVSSPVVCVGAESSAVSCLVNRDTRIRAAVISRPESAASLLSVMNPNVWCVEGTGWSFSDYQRLLKSVTASPQKPTGWEEIHAGGSR